MTDREKAIVMAFTGYAMLTGDKLGVYYKYIEEKLGRPVMTHELAEKSVQETIHIFSQPDFIELCTASDKPVTNGWISVKDRLPEEPGRYLCWFGKNTFAVGASIVPYIPDLHWFASLESLERYENVTHWMPMPEPPRE